MTQPYVTYVAAAGQRDFDVPFPFINRSHVKVRVNGNSEPIIAWPTNSKLRLAAELPSGAAVEIERETPIEEQLVKFQDGNILTAEDLNIATMQSLFRLQEVAGLYERSLKTAQVRLGNNLGVVSTPGDVAQELAELVLEKDVLNNFRARIADIDLNANAILAQSLRVDGLEGAINALGSFNGAGIVTLVQNEATQRIDGDAALASTIALIGAKSGDNTAFIFDTNKVRVSPTESLATRLSALSAADGANSSAILNEITARAAGDATNASAINGLISRVGSAEAAIVSEQNTRASADSALATSLNTLSTTVNGNTASISTLASSVNGLQARYGVSLDVNGYVTGFIQNNNGQSGSFTILADKFSVVTPGRAPLTPFEVTALGVKINGNLVVNGTITSDQLAANSVTQSNSAFAAPLVFVSASSWTAMQSAAITTTGGQVRVDFCGALEASPTMDGTILYRIKRNETVIQSGVLTRLYAPQNVSFVVNTGGGGDYAGSAQLPIPYAGNQSIFVIDPSPPAGTHTYSIEALSTEGAFMGSRQLCLIELKR